MTSGLLQLLPTATADTTGGGKANYQLQKVTINNQPVCGKREQMKEGEDKGKNKINNNKQPVFAGPMQHHHQHYPPIDGVRTGRRSM